MTALLVALGAAVGAPTRYLLDRALQSTHGTAFPWGTFTVNVTAALGLGLVLGGPAPTAVAAAARRSGSAAGCPPGRRSAYETVRLAEEGRPSGAVLNVVMSTFAGLGAVAVGLALGAAIWA